MCVETTMMDFSYRIQQHAAFWGGEGSPCLPPEVMLLTSSYSESLNSSPLHLSLTQAPSSLPCPPFYTHTQKRARLFSLCPAPSPSLPVLLLATASKMFPLRQNLWPRRKRQRGEETCGLVGREMEHCVCVCVCVCKKDEEGDGVVCVCAWV